MKKYRRSLSSLRSQTDRLSDLVNDLLDVSRIETGKLRFDREKFRIDDLINENIEGFGAAFGKHSILVQKTNSLYVVADKYRIHQVLTNLSTNAIKYSPNAKEIYVNVMRDKYQVVVSVQDFGIGISKKDQPKIFDKLYQSIEAEEKTYPGLGMGLYISKGTLTGIAERSG